MPDDELTADAFYLEFAPPPVLVERIERLFVMRDRCLLTTRTGSVFAQGGQVQMLFYTHNADGHVNTDPRFVQTDAETGSRARRRGVDGWLFGIHLRQKADNWPARAGDPATGTLLRVQRQAMQPPWSVSGLWRSFAPWLDLLSGIATDASPPPNRDRPFSERTVRRRVRQATGLAPAQHRGLARFRPLPRQLVVSDTPLALMAADNGYADQAHMSRDVRRRCGLSPAAFRSRWTGGGDVRFVQATTSCPALRLGILIG